MSGLTALGQQTPVAAKNAPAASDVPDDVMVVVFARPGWWDQVGITYYRQVSGEQAKKDLAELARRAGWKPDGVVLRQEPGVAGGPINTSVEFVARTLDARTHMLPLEPIVVTFRRYRHLGAVFVFPQQAPFPYWGPLNHQVPGIAMRGNLTLGSYTFNFTISDPKVSRLDLPIRNPNQPKPESPPQRSRRDVLIKLAMVVIAALGVAALVYGIASYARGR